MLINFTRKFIRESFVPILDLLCFRHYMDIYCGGVDANSFTESDNSSLKRDVRGPNANLNLVVSSESITDHKSRRVEKLQKLSTKNYMRHQHLKDSDLGNVLEECRAKLSDRTNEYKRGIALDQFEDSTSKLNHLLSFRSIEHHLTNFDFFWRVRLHLYTHQR